MPKVKSANLFNPVEAMVKLNSVEGISNLLNQYPFFAISFSKGLGLLSTSICPFSIPASLGIVGYASSEHSKTAEGSAKKKSWQIAAFFFSGIVTSFLVLGFIISYIGQFLIRWDCKFTLLTAVISFFTGVTLIFKFRMPGLKLSSTSSYRSTVAGALGYGALYSVTIITTSTGPVLLLLAAAAVLQSHYYGVLLTVAYGIGRGLLFLLLGTFANNVKTWTGRLKNLKRPAEVIIGIGLVILALMMAKHGLAALEIRL